MASKAFNSLEKALDILCSFDLDDSEFTAQEIADAQNLPLSTIYRYLDVLVQRGFLAKEPGNPKFTLGLTLFKLGNIAASRIQLMDVALPHMQRLSRQAGETVLLTVPSGYEAICLERVETRRLIKLSLERGASLPLYAGASSKILLAYQEESFVDTMIAERGLQRLTKYTLTHPARLKKELKKIREQGFAFSDSEADLGARAVAAPIFGHQGKLIAGLTVAGPADRIKTNEVDRLAAQVVSTADTIFQELGFAPGKKAGTR